MNLLFLRLRLLARPVKTSQLRSCRTSRSALAFGLALAVFLTTLSFGASAQTPSATSPGEPVENDHFLLYVDNGGDTVCREATPLQKEKLDKIVPRNLRQINHTGGQLRAEAISDVANASTNLTIVLRGTTNLEAQPAAKAAFQRAVAAWEAVVTSPVTIFLDADYGPNFFEQPWDSGVLGATSSPSTSTPYSTVRNTLISVANTPEKSTVYNLLPTDSLPTDRGNVAQVSVSHSIARAIGLRNATAESTEPAARIGFNSAFDFDFDRSDGISFNHFDFEAVAIHEIGHALGFTSRSGGSTSTPAVWDLYRFRSGTTSATFTSAQRIMTMGGPVSNSQYYFVPGSSELGLSDGGPDGETDNNADGNQSSHWRQASRNGDVVIGIMDPRIPRRTIRNITSNDINALSIFGFNSNTVAPPSEAWVPTILNADQVELKSWKVDGRTFVYTKLTFPSTGFRVVNWGVPSQAGNAFSVDTLVERWTGVSALMVTSAAQIWDLGALAAGDYTFAFRNSGTTVKTLNFTVSSAPPPANPIDDARIFVFWQYRDFLRRDPDAPGWEHWTNEITQCSNSVLRRFGESEAQCVQRKRENTSAAFFMSPEFQNTGYFVLRVYRGSLNRMPFFGGTGTAQDEFTRDTATVGQGIVVNNALAPDVINSNKQTFVNQFVTRSEFRAIYDGLNNTQYVNRLFETTGVTPTDAERQALIDGLNLGSETRATVLFKVVDGTTTTTGGLLVFNTGYGKAFYDNLFNAAFVQMEYFGYLLRDPDPGGYAFWLGKLNTFGDWVNAEMVKAFINSPEYRSRFGAP